MPDSAFHTGIAIGEPGEVVVFGESSSLRKLILSESVLSPTLVESSECSRLLLKGRCKVVIPERQSGMGAMLDGISNFVLFCFAATL